MSIAATQEVGKAGVLTDSRQFVTFNVGREVFAVPMAPVEEIIRVPETVHVPLAPTSLKGLANLRGKVLPVISLRQALHLDEIAYDDSTRVLVINNGSSIGFVVDNVASVMTIDHDQIEDIAGIQSTVDSDLLNGVIKSQGGDMTMILDFQRLIGTEFQTIVKNAKAAARVGDTVRGETEGKADSSDELQLVSFEVANQEYAFPIEEVQEIVQVLDNISQIPKTEAHVLGVMTLRNRLLPLVSLRQIFRLPAEALNEHNRIVVVSVDSAEGPLSVGVVMDTVNEVLRVQRSLVEPLPTLLARDGESQEILSICRLDEGKRLVSILSAQKMFKVDKVLDAVKAAHGNREEATMDERQESAKVDDEEQFVVFRLADEEYGVPIDSVQEIVRVPEQLTHVPKAPGFIEGVVNLRGSVLPVVDQCRRFGLASPERNDRQRIMVFSINGVRTGFIVDSVSEVLKIAKSTIEPAPSLSDEQAKVIRRVANLEKQQRMILLLEVDNLLDKKEAKAVEKVEKGDKADKAEKVH